MGRKYSTKYPRSTKSSSSRESRQSRRSDDSCDSNGTMPTSIYPSSVKASSRRSELQQNSSYDQDLSPSTSRYERSSADTFDSTLVSEDEIDDVDMTGYSGLPEIPPLPIYNREVVDPNVRPSTPQDFARLFPSMNRLSIRHDEFTPDGNMNLRVDTVVPGRRRITMQLFHLRMYDLARREFSLRRYCRESGREVCNSKRKYAEQAPEGRPTLQRSVSSAIKKGLSARPQFHRANSGGSLFGSKSGQLGKRPTSSYSSGDGDDEFHDYFSRSLSFDRRPKAMPMPTNTIKLEFSNYARVDVSRRGGKSSKRYDFAWWGHKYSWKRVLDKNLNVVSFHLLRDGNNTPVAHIVPETRSPNQVLVDESAGGWVPPCYMWINDKTIIEAVTDVADVIVATGLMALVDECIKERWPKKSHRISAPLTPKAVDLDPTAPRTLVHNMFHRRQTEQPTSPLRYATPIHAY